MRAHRRAGWTIVVRFDDRFERVDRVAAGDKTLLIEFRRMLDY